MRFFVPLVAVCALAGCMTPRDQVGVVRAMKNYSATGQPERAQEMAQVAIDCGALDADPVTGAVIPGDVDPATVEDTLEAAAANAAVIAAERKTRRAALTFAQEFGKGLLSQTPWGSAAIGLLGAGWALLRLRKARGAVVGLVNAGMELREKAKAGEPLGEAVVKSVLGFWSDASGAKAEVESALAKIKPVWQPKPAEAPKA